VFNLLDNAPNTPTRRVVELRAYRDQATSGSRFWTMATASGADLERIFDKFYRGKRQGPQSPGIGSAWRSAALRGGDGWHHHGP